MKRRVYVWPLGDKWVTSEFNRVEAFCNDVAHFGWSVAFYNLCYLIRPQGPKVNAV